MKSRKDRQGRSSGERKRTDFKRFADGAILDLVRHAKGRRVGLLLFKKGKVRSGRQIEYKGTIWAPSTHPILASMRLPLRMAQAPADGVEDILSAIVEFLLTYIDFSSEEDARATAHYGLSTWFTHRLPMAPILSIVGPTGSGKSKLAGCLNCICRRPLFFADLDPATLRSLPMRLRPTVILDEIRLNEEMIRLLRAGTHRNGFTYRGGRPIDLFGPKVLVTQEPLADAALISRAVEIRLVPTARDMPDLTSFAIEVFESEILPHIFRFFLENYNGFTVPDLGAGCLSPHKRDVARALAGSYDTSLDQQTIVRLLQPQDENASGQRFFTKESAVLSVLIEACVQKVQFVLAGETAKFANQKLEKQGEWLRLSDKRAGAILNKLGFKTEKIGNIGRGMWMTQEVMKMINNLGRHYGIFVVPPPVNGTETQNVDAGGKEPGKKPCNTAAVADMPKQRRARKRKQHA